MECTQKSLSLGLFVCSLLIPLTQASNYDIAFLFSVLCSTRFAQQLVLDPHDTLAHDRHSYKHTQDLQRCVILLCCRVTEDQRDINCSDAVHPAYSADVSNCPFVHFKWIIWPIQNTLLVIWKEHIVLFCSLLDDVNEHNMWTYLVVELLLTRVHSLRVLSVLGLSQLAKYNRA